MRLGTLPNGQSLWEDFGKKTFVVMKCCGRCTVYHQETRSHLDANRTRKLSPCWSCAGPSNDRHKRCPNPTHLNAFVLKGKCFLSYILSTNTDPATMSVGLSSIICWWITLAGAYSKDETSSLLNGQKLFLVLFKDKKHIREIFLYPWGDNNLPPKRMPKTRYATNQGFTRNWRKTHFEWKDG